MDSAPRGGVVPPTFLPSASRLTTRSIDNAKPSAMSLPRRRLSEELTVQGSTCEYAIDDHFRSVGTTADGRLYFRGTTGVGRFLYYDKACNGGGAPAGE